MSQWLLGPGAQSASLHPELTLGEVLKVTIASEVPYVPLLNGVLPLHTHPPGTLP